MADAGAGGHHLEVVECLRAPFQELVPLHVALIFEIDVIAERRGRAELIDHHRMIDDEVDGDERIDLLRVTAELRDRIAHRREIDDAGYAGKILHQHTRGAVLDLAVGRLGVVLPIDDRLHVVSGDGLAVLEPQHVLEQHLHREGQAADVAVFFRGGRKAEIIVGFAPRGERGAGVQRIVADGSHGRAVPFPVEPRGRGGEAARCRAGAPGRANARVAGAIAGGGEGGKGAGKQAACGKRRTAPVRRRRSHHLARHPAQMTRKLLAVR